MGISLTLTAFDNRLCHLYIYICLEISFIRNAKQRGVVFIFKLVKVFLVLCYALGSFTAEALWKKSSALAS